MKPISSPLRILDFGFTRLDFEIIHGEKPVNLNDIHNNYELNIDFDIYNNEFLQVFIYADVNFGKKKLPGYSFKAEAACIFQFDKNIKVGDKERLDLEGFSTIYIALNSLRGLISNFTSTAAFGRYILPSIDLNDLIDKKRKKHGVFPDIAKEEEGADLNKKRTTVMKHKK